METIKTDILIAGAGPTGLSLACQLVRYGIGFIIVDKKEGITPYSKAIGVQARTLEIFDQMGLASKAVKKGSIAEKVRLIAAGKVRGGFDFSNAGEGLSSFPFVLILEQSKTEQLLYNYLRKHQKNANWKTQLTGFSQTKTGISAQVKTANGIQVIEAKYLVGCDGPKSMVRHKLGLSFEGSTFERIFYVADTQVDWNFSHRALHVCFSKNSFVVFFPLKGEERYRIVGVFPEEFNRDEGEILYEEIEARIKDESKLELDIYNVNWFSTYKVHTRHVNNFSKGRCFLAGDSAHIHSPAGAQGMNTGIQDAYNLAWKIAMAARGDAGDKLLSTYNTERLGNAKNLLKTTDRVFELAAGGQWPLPFLRMKLFPLMAKYIFELDIVKKFIFPRVSQTAINYRSSVLSRHSGDIKVKAGDRIPYFLVEGKSIYDKLHQPKFHLIAFFENESDFRLLKAEVENSYSDWIDFNTVPLDEHIAKIFEISHSFNLLLRPDNHIAFISAENSIEDLTNYMTEIIE